MFAFLLSFPFLFMKNGIRCLVYEMNHIRFVCLLLAHSMEFLSGSRSTELIKSHIFLLFWYTNCLRENDDLSYVRTMTSRRTFYINIIIVEICIWTFGANGSLWRDQRRFTQIDQKWKHFEYFPDLFIKSMECNL